MTADRIPRCGIVGAARARQGTGPFLASHVEAAGGVVTGVAGRDAARAANAALDLAHRLGHAVEAHADLTALLASGIDALVVATPDEAHLESLRAALDAGVAVLCEKPIVPVEQHAALGAVLDGFRARDLLLMEVCQWPYALPVFDELWPGVSTGAESFGMRLSPAAPGPGMLAGSLSHFLGVVQARWDVTAATRIDELGFTGEGPERSSGAADRLTTSFTLRDAGPRPARCRLELVACPEQPRPAWFEFDGHRVERRIDVTDYSISFARGDRIVAAQDPAALLVAEFVWLLDAPDPADQARPGTQARRGAQARARDELRAIEQRARLYREVLEAFGRR